MNKALKMVLSLTAMLAAGCSDSGMMAPKTQAPEIGQPWYARGGQPGRVSMASDTAVFSFQINGHRGGTLDFGGGNYVTIPGDVVCDPTTSDYGPNTWDRPCDTIKSNLSITAKVWMDANNHPRVDFSPDIRFEPTRDPGRFVIVTFADQAAAAAWGTDILYCRNLTTGCVRESSSDPTMATYTDRHSGQVRRRVKHFSGYSITTGDDDSRGSMNRFINGGSKIQP